MSDVISVHNSDGMSKHIVLPIYFIGLYNQLSLITIHDQFPPPVQVVQFTQPRVRVMVRVRFIQTSVSKHKFPNVNFSFLNNFLYRRLLFRDKIEKNKSEICPCKGRKS